MKEFVFTRSEAAEVLKISLPTLDNFIKRKDNPLPHITTGKRILIPINSLERWIEEEAARCTKKNQ